jgi:hypothetical protein
VKKVIILIFNLILAQFVLAQQKAVTEKGEEVILLKDGTWKYVQENNNLDNEIKTNTSKFKKNDEATFLLKSNKVKIGFWLNSKIWSFKKATNNSEAEYELQLKDGDLYGMVISEKIQIPIETLKSIAIKNASEVAPDVKIMKEEYRIVNGIKVLLLQMNGTMQGISFSYLGYYYSNTSGTVQFVTYTSSNLLESYLPKIESLLNGIVELN